MKKNHREHPERVFRVLGKTVCTMAGSVVGFVLTSPVLVIPFAAAGFFTGLILEKLTLKYLILEK